MIRVSQLKTGLSIAPKCLHGWGKRRGNHPRRRSMPSNNKHSQREKSGNTATGAKKNTDGQEFSAVGTLYRPLKKPVTLRLDADVIAWFKAQGEGYQTRINKALRGLMLGQRKRGA